MIAEKYGVEADGMEAEAEYDNYLEAREEARKRRGRVICFEFEYTNSYVVDDYRKDGAA